MKNFIILFAIIFFIFDCESDNTNSKKPIVQNLASTVFDTKEEAKTKIFIPELVGKSYSYILKLYGIPSDSNLVNSTSAKGRMPLYLVNYLNSSDSLVSARIFIWKNDSLFREVCFKQTKGKWLSIGGSIQKVKIVHYLQH